MPDPATHHVFGRQVISELPKKVRISIDRCIFDRAIQGPDPWSTIGFYGGKNKQYAKRSNVMHKSNTGAFLLALANEAKLELSPQTFSVLAGVICHYCLDKYAHPYIVCKGGEFDGTEETRAQNGGHVRLERAIDSYYIRHEYGKVPWHFSIPRYLMKLKQYPEGLREPLDKVYEAVYGWEKSFDLINASLRDERLFYSLMQDPFGLVHMLLRPFSDGKTNYCIYSYYRRDADSGCLDYMNECHNEWRHPFEPNLILTDSFFDLFAKAKQEAVKMIQLSYSWIFCDEPVELDRLFGNANYTTGFDCDDTRNLSKPICDPLVYYGKYWNNG